MPQTPSAPATIAGVPPLPRIDQLLASSQRIGALPGLREAALVWHQEAIPARAKAHRDAQRLATPRIWPDTIAGLAQTTARIAKTAAPDAPLALLLAGAKASGLPIAPPNASAGAIARAQRLVRAGGPAYIKLGQFIATADGLLPPQWVSAFAWCRDEAPPLRPGVARKIVERELGELSGRLAEFDEEPLATGSIGQVHLGRLDDGREIVVKVRRPRLRRRLRADIETLAIVAAAAERASDAAKSANLRGFIELFAQLALEELDFRLEAANLVEASAVLEALGADGVQAPRPIPGMVTERLLVMERMPGVAYNRLSLAANEIDGRALLHAGIKSVLEATLVHGIFHGDMHAGNVLVAPDGSFSMVDFGITGRLTAAQRAGLVRFLVGFAASDARIQVEAMREFGALAPGADIAGLVTRLQLQLDRINARTDGAVTFQRLGETLGSLLTTLASGGMTMPKELVLFFKNLLYLSGFAATVSPDTDLFGEIELILTEMFAREQNGLAAIVSSVAPTPPAA